MASLCLLTQPMAANATGLIGTIILAWGALRIIPAATRAYRVTRTLADLSELRRRKADPELGRVDSALQAKLEKQEKDLEDLLTSSQHTLTASRDRWTGRHTALIVLGVLLSAASDLLPLLTTFCKSSLALG